MRGATKAVKLWIPDGIHALEADLNEKQVDELFALMNSSQRHWAPTRMVAIGGAELKLINGKTKKVSFLTIPGKWDAFQIEGSQFVTAPPGQIEKLIASWPLSTRLSNP